MRKQLSIFLNMLIMLLCVTLVMTGCTDDGDSKPKPAADVTAPTAVISQSSGLISSSQALTVTFSEEMLTTSLILGGSMATQSSSAWSSDNLTVTISPVSKWTEGTAKTLTVDATDLAGNAVAQITASFTIDSTAPTATTKTPDTGATIISAQSIVVNFSESMSATVTLGGTIGTAAGAWSTTTLSNDTLTITPSTEWSAGSATLTISGSDANGVALSQITLTYTVVACKYVNQAFTGTEAGTPSAPYKTIQAAVTAASSGRVLVAEGTYSGSGPVVSMKEGVSLYGGYKNADWNTRNTTTYASIITDSKGTAGASFTNPNRAVVFDGSTTTITTATIFDGFTVNASSANYSAVLFITQNSSPTIQNNILVAGAGSVAEVYNIMIYDTNGTIKASPVIQTNQLKANNTSIGASQYYYAIYSIGGSTNVTVTSNTIELPQRTNAGAEVYLLLEDSATDDFYSVRSNTFVETDATPTGTVYYYWDEGATGVTVANWASQTVSVTEDATSRLLSYWGNTKQ